MMDPERGPPLPEGELLLSLPDVAFSRIYGFLDAKDKLSLMATCKAVADRLCQAAPAVALNVFSSTSSTIYRYLHKACSRWQGADLKLTLSGTGKSGLENSLARALDLGLGLASEHEGFAPWTAVRELRLKVGGRLGTLGLWVRQETEAFSEGLRGGNAAPACPLPTDSLGMRPAAATHPTPLQHCKLGGVCGALVGPAFPRLTKLELADCCLEGPSLLAALHHNSQLQELVLADCTFDPGAMSSLGLLARLPGLSKLTTDVLPESERASYLRGMADQLTHLVLEADEGCGWVPLVQPLSNLQHLEVVPR